MSPITRRWQRDLDHASVNDPLPRPDTLPQDTGTVACSRQVGIDQQEFARGDKVRRVDAPESVLWVREVDPYGKLDGTGKVLCFNSGGHGKWISINELELAL